MITIRDLRQFRQLQIPPTIGILFGVWILVMISLPIIRWTLGDSTLHFGIIAGVLAQIILVLVILWHAWNRAYLLRVTLVVVFGAWLAEAVGSHTGIPFGRYDYTNILQPQLLGVPLLIPLAWMMMLPPAWAVSRAIVGSGSRIKFALISAAAMTAWDLFLDPQMVAWNFWIWESPGIYFGIPLVNFVGWFLVSGLISWLVNPPSLPLTALITVYGVTWILESIGQFFFWGLPGPAIFGFVGMGFFLFWGLRNLRKNYRNNSAPIPTTVLHPGGDTL
jgi:lycopene beta-cyclase